MTTTRDRKIDFIERQFGCAEDERIMVSLFRKHGLDWLHDDQLKAMIKDWRAADKLRSRMNRQNRQIADSAKHGRAA